MDSKSFNTKLKGIDLNLFNNIKRINCLMKGVCFDKLVPLMMSGQKWIDKFIEKMGNNMLAEFKILEEFPVEKDGTLSSVT